MSKYKGVEPKSQASPKFHWSVKSHVGTGTAYYTALSPELKQYKWNNAVMRLYAFNVFPITVAPY